MNYIAEIHDQCQSMPVALQKQVLDFICFLKTRYRHKPIKASTDQACGILKAPHGVSLTDRDTAISKRGSQL